MTGGSLSEFGLNVYSQYGEDGIIREIFCRLSEGSELDHWCVEFGAWDGVHLSNTCRLIREDGYSAVFIEGEPSRALLLETNFPQENVYKVCRFIELDGPGSLEATLKDFPVPTEFDFLSVDVDGCDFWIWKSLNNYKPKVVCIEFNPTIPNSIYFVQERDLSVKQGSSAKALTELGAEKGYALVAATHCNLFFVRSDLKNLLIDEDQTLEDLNPGGNDGTFIFSGYDGTLLLSADSIRLPWHGVSLDSKRIQLLPAFLRIFPGDFSKFRRAIWELWSRVFASVNQ